MLDLARVKAWSFARPVIKNNRMAFTDCGAAYLRHGRIIHLTRFPDWSAMGGGGDHVIHYSGFDWSVCVKSFQAI